MATKLTDKQKSMLGSGAIGLASGIGLGTSLAQIEDTSADEAFIKGVGNTQFDTGNTNTLMASFDTNNMARTNYTADEIRGFTPGQIAGSIIGNTATSMLGSKSITEAFGKGLFTLAGGLLGAGVGDVKAQKRAAELNSLSEENNKLYLNNFANAVSNTQNKMFNNSLLNIGAYGGPLFNHGGDWSNGLTFINEGGTHEQNPLGGVPVGVDQEGTPNLVEEGEIIWNDYVFSNRLKPTKKQLETVGFNPKYEGMTFAKIVEKVQQDSAENPLDKISTDTLNENLMYLMTMQEEIRMKKEANKNKFKYGGKFGNVFVGTGNEANILGHLYETAEEAAEAQRLIEEENALLNGIADIEANTIMDKVNAKIPALEQSVRDYEIQKAYNSIFNTDKKKAPKADNNPFVNAGTIAPLISSAGQLIYNTLKPIDKSNVIAAKAYNKVPMMSLPRIGGKKSFTPTDKNQYVNPIIAQGNATARALQNSGVNASQTLGSLIANNYNTQKAISEALNTIDQADFTKEMQVGQFNLGIDQANLSASQTEQNANILTAKDLARAEVADASTIEGLGALKGSAINASLNTLTKGIADSATQGINWNLIKDNPAYADAFKHFYGKQAKCGGMLTRKKRRK